MQRKVEMEQAKKMEADLQLLIQSEGLSDPTGRRLPLVNIEKYHFMTIPFFFAAIKAELENSSQERLPFLSLSHESKSP